jgi:hypothetical protein
MEAEDPQALFAETLGQLPDVIATSTEFLHGPEVKAAQFSDTIFLWATVGAPRDGGDRAEAKDCVDAVCGAVFGLMHRCVRRGIFLRGAIAFGECFIRDKPPAFVGRPIAAAADLEHRQQWSGVALHETAEAVLQYEDRWSKGLLPFVRYLVPMKGPPDEIRVVIKWPRGMHLPHPLELMRPRGSTCPKDVEAKIVHTTAFFEAFRNTFGYPDRPARPIQMVNGQIDELADAAKTHDSLEWYSDVLTRLRDRAI